MYRSNIPATLAGLLARVPVRLAQIHNVDSWDSGRQAFLERIVARGRTATLAVSRAVQRDVMARLGLPESRVPVLYNGIDTARFSPNGTSEFRDRWGVGETELLFVVPARLHPQKNPFGVLEAFEKLGPNAAARLVFVGAGKLEEELKQRVQRSSMAARVALVGQVDDMPAVYRAADAVVLSSFKEGFSNAVVEALAVGKPVIASDVGGNSEAINSPKVGWIHPAGDGRALAEQLHAVLQMGRAGLAEMRTDCVARAQAFSIEALVEETHQLYGRLLGRFPE
jgi:glycosyltransferase involved in cell wall biosynthesis